MEELDWLWPQLDADASTRLRSCMALFAQPSTKIGELREAVASVEDLEKRYIAYNPAQLAEEELKGRVLVATVGFSPLPVILSCLILKPKRLYLLHSQQSEEQARSIQDDPLICELGLVPDRTSWLRPISLDDAPSNYEVLHKISREQSHFPLVVDISGGVKVMGVSLAAAAFWLRIPVIYQLGEEINRTIKPFSERLVRLRNPFDHFGAPDLLSIQELFSAGEYDAALAVCENLRDKIGDVGTLGRLQLLSEFITIYRDWDAFAHSKFEDSEDRRLATRLRNSIRKMQQYKVEFADLASLQENVEFLSALEQTWRARARNNSEIHRLIDIYVAALRRAKGGKYDDAVARLYRCFEMSATICLQRDCRMPDPNRPDYSYFIELYGSMQKLQEEYGARLPGRELPAQGLGLEAQMNLLRISQQPTHQPIAGIYFKAQESNLMELRNRSTLAHGTVPVSPNEYEELHNRTADLVSRVVGRKEEFARLVRKATHLSLRAVA